MVASLLVFLPSAGYLWQAWNSSRLDSWDWSFFLLCIPAAILAVKSGEESGKVDWWALSVAVPALFLSVGVGIHHVYAASVLGSVWFVWAVIWLSGGWRYAYRLLPVFLILSLGTPSSTYQISRAFAISSGAALSIKFLLAIAGLLWICCAWRKGWYLKKSTFFFIGAILFTALLLLHSEELYFSGKSFVPVYPMQAGRFIGRTIIPDINTKRFFATSEVKQYRYMAGDADLSVLAVQCCSDIHEIHSASHCLRTSQWKINSEKLFYLESDFAVTEIEAEKGLNHILVWVWYSGRDFSTPSFLGFRRHFRPGMEYHTYQISIAATDGVEQSRAILQEFIEALPQEVKSVEQ